MTSEQVDNEQINTAAAALREAANSRVPCAPVRDILGTSTDLDAAYAVQQVNVDLDVVAGRRVSGHKIGLTAKAVQQMFGVDQPDCGTLFADMCLADGVDMAPDSLIAPRAEAEIAMVLGSDLDGDELCVVDIINAVDYVLPALEIVDSRIKDWNLTIVDTIADNASGAFYVLGSQPKSLADLDVRDVPMDLQCNGETKSTGIGAACLGNPLHAALWLANEMNRVGRPLRAGHCLMTGALGPMIPFAPGDQVRADMGALGTVSTRFVVAD